MANEAQGSTTTAAERPAAAEAHAPPAQSAEALDQVIQTTSPPLRWALGAVVVAVVAALLWACLAHLPQRVTTTGAVSESLHARDVTAAIAGTVVITADIGDKVSAGSEIGTIRSFADATITKVVVGEAGVVRSVFVTDGDGVEPGTLLAHVVTDASSGADLTIVTYVSETEAARFTQDARLEALVFDPSTGSRVVTPLVLESVSDVPAEVESMVVEAGSSAVVEAWTEASGAILYRVALTLPSSSSLPVALLPQPGEVVEIVDTYAEPRPIELLFGD